MKRSILVLIFISTILLTFGHVRAADLEIRAIPGNLTVQAGANAIYELEIENHLPVQDSFTVHVAGPHLEWKMPGDLLITVDPNSSESTALSFCPHKEGAYFYNITVASRTHSSITATTPIYLYVTAPLAIKNLTLEQSGSDLIINLGVQSSIARDIDVTFLIKSDKGEVVNTFSETAQVDGTKNIHKTLSLKGMKPGNYQVDASLEELSSTGYFAIEPVHNVTLKTERALSPFCEEITIYVINEGNVVEHNYTVTRDISAGALTGFVTNPQACYGEGINRTCNFVIEKLEPGATAKVKYRIEHWPSYTYSIAALIIIIAIGVFAYFRFTEPRITKRYIKKEGDQHSVILEIKNPYLHHLKNVVVRDWVNPLAHVLHKEIDSIKPVLRKNDAGTELIWNLGDMKPREERILSYKIKGLVQGTLRMPRAYIRFKNRKGELIRIFSNPLVLE